LDGSWNVYNYSFFEIPLSHVAYSHDPYKMSHLHNFPCPTKYSHYQSRDTCKIPTLSTFPSKPYEPRDMKGNFGKFPHWDTSESSMWREGGRENNNYKGREIDNDNDI
jgi:hypothetical protein